MLSSTRACLLLVMALCTTLTLAQFSRPFKYGVAIGGWLLAEPWMYPKRWKEMGGGSSEWGLVHLIGQQKADEVFATHWKTWFTQEHANMIKASNLDHVKIALGFWIIEELVQAPGEVYARGGWMELKRGLRQLQAVDLNVLLVMHALPGVSALNQQFAGNATDQMHFYEDANYRRAITWIVILTAMSHLDPDFETVVGIHCVNEPHNDASKTPGLGQYYADFVTTVRVVEHALNVPCEVDLKPALDRLADSKNAIPGILAAIPLLPIYATKAGTSIDVSALTASLTTYCHTEKTPSVGSGGGVSVQLSGTDVNVTAGDVKVSVGDGKAPLGHTDVSAEHVKVSTGDTNISTDNVKVSTDNIKVSAEDVKVSSGSGNVKVSARDLKFFAGHVNEIDPDQVDVAAEDGVRRLKRDLGSAPLCREPVEPKVKAHQSQYNAHLRRAAHRDPSRHGGRSIGHQIHHPKRQSQPHCLTTVAMPKRWQSKGDPESMAPHVLGPRAYDDHLYFSFGGVADANYTSYLQTICSYDGYDKAKANGEVPYGHGEFSLATNFNSTLDQIRGWGDAQKTLYDEESFWTFWTFRIEDPSDDPSTKLANEWSYLYAVEKGLLPIQPDQFFNASICEGLKKKY